MSKKRTKKKPTVSKMRLHKQAWSLARSMMEIHDKTFDRSLFNIHVHCPTCDMSYCQGADGQDQFCNECPYKPYEIDGEHCGCIKELQGTRTCQHCGGKHESISAQKRLGKRVRNHS